MIELPCGYFIENYSLNYTLKRRYSGKAKDGGEKDYEKMQRRKWEKFEDDD